MEHALYIRDLNDLKYLNKDKFNIIYFGTEFCEKLIPGKEEIVEILKFIRSHNVKLTFVTPYCTNYGILKLERILPLFSARTEVVFNDWGVLKLIRKNKLIPILGRLLVAIKRDPRFETESKYINYFKTSNLNNSIFQTFLIKHDIFRIELDNVIQGYSFRLSGNLKSSIHYPFVFITTARKCIAANCDLLTNKRRVYWGDCSFECSKYTFLADLPGSGFKIILKGNSQFYKNDKKPNKLERWNVDRLVFSPKLPFCR